MTWSMALHPRSAVPSTAPQVRNHVYSNSGPLVPTSVCQPPSGMAEMGIKAVSLGCRRHTSIVLSTACWLWSSHPWEVTSQAVRAPLAGPHVPVAAGPAPPAPALSQYLATGRGWVCPPPTGSRTALGADGLAWLPRLRVPRSSGQSPDVLDAPQGGTCSSSTASCSTRGPGRAASSLSSGCLWTISCYLRTTGLWPLDSWRCVRAGPSLRDAWTPCGWGAPDGAFARLWGQDGATAGHILSPPLAPPRSCTLPRLYTGAVTHAHMHHTQVHARRHTPLLGPDSFPFRSSGLSPGHQSSHFGPTAQPVQG